jgi:hypothetical protein
VYLEKQKIEKGGLLDGVQVLEVGNSVSFNWRYLDSVLDKGRRE